MYSFLVHLHSGLRWLVLFALILAVVLAFVHWRQGKPYAGWLKKSALYAFIFSHLQLVIGLILYFISPKVIFDSAAMKDSVTRFFLVEHISMMILSIVLITVGYSIAKRKPTDLAKAKTTFWFYLIALVLILLSIPWPWQAYGAGWG